ncbi:MAG: glycoside hydrolase family 13 protein [Ancrocorticia sp.]|uniref:glycoside hydrolase family 13 protein n=1 Tax=Ancrocorticia sp. TaxID=2593684 RepID=UPI003F8FD44D
MSIFPASDANWWRQAVVYQIYPRSFADANGDGLGDIAGITSRADYLQQLGVDAVWLSPFYPSELADGGYDVADYRNVDPRLGSLADFDKMLSALHSRDIRVIVDIVPNHTSDQHEWFQAALKAGRGSPERDRYIFREGKGPNGDEIPSDWVASFGGPSWTRVEDGQWYLHNFAPQQPDLNWSNPDVRADFVKTIRFWADRGVDGFRIDVAHMLVKDLSMDPLPTKEELDAIPVDGNHPMWDRDEVQDVYAQWRAVFNEYDPPRMAVAEAWVASDRVPRYANPHSLGQSFNFDLLEADFDAVQFRRIVTHNLSLAAGSGSSSTWVLSNHDVVRHPTRYGLPNPARRADGKPAIKHGQEWLQRDPDGPVLQREQGLRRARAATTFILGLPGSTYIYQGEELGLHEVYELDSSERQDPTFFRTHGEEVGRDGCRVPLPWTASGTSHGFGANGSHFPQPDWFGKYSVETEEGDLESPLRMYRSALALRKQLETSETMEWIETGRDDVLAFERPNGWKVVTNFGTEPYAYATDTVALSSEPVFVENGKVEIPGETTVWIAG